jgi:GT2 family glycosyltransferase
MGYTVSIRNCSAVTAACMMVKKNVFDEVDGFDERYKIGFGDTDFCLKVQEKGYLNVYTPYAELYHHESATRGQTFEGDPHPKDTRRLIKKWRKIIQDGDPFYNPNLPLNNQSMQVQQAFKVLK